MTDNEPDWAIILDTIYRDNIVWPHDADYTEDHPVVSAVDMDAESAQKSLSMLSQSNLLERTHVGRMRADIPYPNKGSYGGLSEQAEQQGTHIGLTPHGFSVAHQREVMRQKHEDEERRVQSQNEVNSAIGFLTLGLLVLTFIDTVLYSLFQIHGPLLGVYTGLGIGILAVSMIAWKLNASDLLNPNPT